MARCGFRGRGRRAWLLLLERDYFVALSGRIGIGFLGRFYGNEERGVCLDERRDIILSGSLDEASIRRTLLFKSNPTLFSFQHSPRKPTFPTPSLVVICLLLFFSLDLCARLFSS